MNLTQEERNQVRKQVQDAGYRAWENAGRKGTIVMATGVGKSKLAVKRVTELAEKWYPSSDPRPEILLVTPTEKLRDENWPAEFAKWGAGGHMENLVKRICFASLKNEKGNRYKLVILDEIHRLTFVNAEGFLEEGTITQFLSENICDEVMGLTATAPAKDRDTIKASIVEQIAPVCFNYPLDQAVADGIIPPYQIVVIMVPLERMVKEIKSGTTKNPFMTTEVSAYEYLNKQVMKAQIATKKNPNSQWAKSMYGARARFIANLPSKTRVARKLMENKMGTKRTIIFCGSIDQSRELCGQNVYNSSPEDKKRDMLTAFKNKEISYCGVVNAVNKPLFT